MVKDKFAVCGMCFDMKQTLIGPPITGILPVEIVVTATCVVLGIALLTHFLSGDEQMHSSANEKMGERWTCFAFRTLA